MLSVVVIPSLAAVAKAVVTAWSVVIVVVNVVISVVIDAVAVASGCVIGVVVDGPRLTIVVVAPPCGEVVLLSMLSVVVIPTGP
mmetsp:Transcript_41942/g.91475  ORF Transcript_41942/g.91475 Transcript_41942/m.91475 type:complete len:84 (-) Transcript_41942:700-951(-)